MGKQGALKKVFSLFTYKDKPESTNFYIPEINESSDDHEAGQDKASQDEEAQTGNEKSNNEKNEAKYVNKTEEQDKNASEESSEDKADTGYRKKRKRIYTLSDENEKKQMDEKKDESAQSDKQTVGNDKQINSETLGGSGIRIKKPIKISELNKKKNAKKEDGKEDSESEEKSELKKDYKSNLELIRKEFNYPTNNDLVVREFLINEKTKAFLVYMEGMVDRFTVNNFILAPILREAKRLDSAQGDCKLDFILDNVLETHQVKKVNKLSDVIDGILVGDTGIYADGCDYLIFCETKGFEKRSVTTPQIEGVIRGSQEAFSENIRTNITLLRRIIKDKDLTTEFLTVGNSNKNNIAIAYLHDVINPAIVTEVKRRLDGIKTDFISSSGMLEQMIEDSPMSIIPTVLATERPDRTASHIVEGKLAIITDGAPYAIIVPVTISSLFHSPEDSSLRWQYGCMLRLIRIFAVFIATMLPGMYVALTTFHVEMIPTDLLIAIAKARENVPFPTIVEVVLMEISFELIREAGIRIPSLVGNTIGIIGALILGQAAVQANLVSPVMIIIVAFTGLGNFAIPDFSLAFGARIIRLAFIFAGFLLGFYGISLVLVALGFLMVNIKSFGVPFFSIFAPRTSKSHDVLIHWPAWRQELRPDNINAIKVRRQPDISRIWTVEKPANSYSREDDNE